MSILPRTSTEDLEKICEIRFHVLAWSLRALRDPPPKEQTAPRRVSCVVDALSSFMRFTSIYANLVQLHTFTVLRQNALTFTLPPPYARFMSAALMRASVQCHVLVRAQLYAPRYPSAEGDHVYNLRVRVMTSYTNATQIRIRPAGARARRRDGLHCGRNAKHAPIAPPRTVYADISHAPWIFPLTCHDCV